MPPIGSTLDYLKVYFLLSFMVPSAFAVGMEVVEAAASFPGSGNTFAAVGAPPQPETNSDEILRTKQSRNCLEMMVIQTVLVRSR